MLSPSSRSRRGLALLLSLALLLAPAAVAGQAIGQSTQQEAGDQDANRTDDSEETNDTHNDSNTEQSRTNESGNDGSNATESNTGRTDSPRSEDGQSHQNDSRQESDQSEEGAERSRGGERGRPDDRPGADPVEIRDRAGGFASRAPPDSPRPTVAVDARNASATVERPDVVPMAVQIDHVVEFADEDGDGAYDVGEPVVDRLGLEERSTRIVRDEANASRTVVYDLGNGSELRLAFGFGVEHGDEVGAKLDVIVEDYAFESSDTRIALGSRVEIEGGLERTRTDGKPAIAGQAGEQVSYLSWVPTAQVDGAQQDVASSVHVDAEEPSESAIVYWAYPQGETIVHDPTLGVQDAIRDLAGRISTFGVALAGTVAVLGVGYAVRTRWRL